MATKFGEALGLASIPDSREAREAFAAEPVRSRRLTAAACTLLLVVGFAFTPPGSAIAEDIGQLLGIGDEPSDPGLVQMEGPVNATVIGTGTSPNGTPFELAQTTAGRPDDAARQTCVSVSLPDPAARVRGGSCLTAFALEDLAADNVLQSFPYMGPSVLGEDGDLLVTMTARPDVARVEVSFPAVGGEVTREATLAPFDAGPSRAVGDSTADEPTPLVYGVAFMPSSALRALPSGQQSHIKEYRDLNPVQGVLQQGRVVAYDKDGNVLDEDSVGEILGARYSIAHSKALEDTSGG